MTYRLQYNSSEYRGLLASSQAAWAAEDRDLAIVSLEGHVLYASRRLLAFFSPALDTEAEVSWASGAIRGPRSAPVTVS